MARVHQTLTNFLCRQVTCRPVLMKLKIQLQLKLAPSCLEKCVVFNCVVACYQDSFVL